MSTTIDVAIHLVTRPDLATYAAIPKTADPASVALKAAEPHLWFGDATEAPGSGGWTRPVARHGDGGAIDLVALHAAVEDVLVEFVDLHADAFGDDAVTLQLGSESESSVYYYRALPQQWCNHEWMLLAAPAHGDDDPKPWQRTAQVAVTDLAGREENVDLLFNFAVAARFDVDWL